VESYRDAFELLFGFVEQATGKPPTALKLADLDAPLVLDFLDYLEMDRHKISSRLSRVMNRSHMPLQLDKPLARTAVEVVSPP